MIESKSRFARRIGKSVWWVSVYCRRGIIPTNERGFVMVDVALKRLSSRRRRGRPSLPRADLIVPVRVWVRRRQKRVIQEIAREMRQG